MIFSRTLVWLCWNVQLCTVHTCYTENCVCFEGTSHSWGKYWSKTIWRVYVSDDCFTKWPFGCGGGKLPILNKQEMLFFRKLTSLIESKNILVNSTHMLSRRWCLVFRHFSRMKQTLKPKGKTSGLLWWLLRKLVIWMW